MSNHNIVQVNKNKITDALLLKTRVIATPSASLADTRNGNIGDHSKGPRCQNAGRSLV